MDLIPPPLQSPIAGPEGKLPSAFPAWAAWFQKLQMLVNDQVALVGTTAQRPTTGNYARRPYMDTTLVPAGKMIWRNASNTGWVDATGNAA